MKKNNEKMPQGSFDNEQQINHIGKVQQPPKDKESEQQKIIDQQIHSEPLKDMHLESGEKINEYQI